MPHPGARRAADNAAPASGGAAGWDFSRIPVQALPARQAASALTGGLPQEPIVANDEDPLSAIVGGPKAVGAPTKDYEGVESQPGGPTLSKVSVGKPTVGECGAFNWGIRWKLSGGAPSGGYIVQKLMLDIKTQKCATDAGAAKPSNVSVVYWEAWRVDKSKKITAQTEGGAPVDDVFARAPTAAMLASTGSVRFTGEARYHDGLDISKYGFVATGKAPAFSLPMTWSDPGLTGGSNAVPHILTASWDCCATGSGASKDTEVTAE